MQAKTVKKSKKAICPKCQKVFQAQGLGGHLRFCQAEKPSEITKKPKVKAGEMKAKSKSAMSAGLTAPSKSGAYDCLQTAIEALKKRDQEIQEELVRLDALQTEKETITLELQAVEAAIKVFRR